MNCRDASEPPPRQAIGVADALARDGDIVRVRGTLVAARGEPFRLCERIETLPSPRCAGASLDVAGQRDLSPLENTRTVGNATIAEGVTVAGRVVGETLRIEHRCRTQRVIDAFETETGDRLSVNPLSLETLDSVDFATHPAQYPPDLRRKYGFFRIYVRYGRDHSIPKQLGVQNFAPDERGVSWHRRDGHTLALSLYDGGELALVWSGGRGRRLDHRWERLDRFMRELAQSDE